MDYVTIRHNRWRHNQALFDLSRSANSLFQRHYWWLSRWERHLCQGKMPCHHHTACRLLTLIIEIQMPIEMPKIIVQQRAASASIIKTISTQILSAFEMACQSFSIWLLRNAVLRGKCYGQSKMVISMMQPPYLKFTEGMSMPFRCPTNR